MKTIKQERQEYIQKNITSCLDIAKEKNSLVIYSKPIKSDEYLINIVFQKDYFKPKIENKRKIDNDLLFVLHLVHNFPINSPKLFCLTSLSHIGIELTDGKNLLEDVIKSSWNKKIQANEIILKIPNFIEEILAIKNYQIFVGRYSLNYEYDYNMLSKIPHSYFNIVDQIINIRTGYSEKRFLMITSLFFLVFTYKSGFFSYHELKLVFWASVYSVYGINKEDPYFGFEFSRNGNQRITLHLNTRDGKNILNILLYIFRARGVNYLVQDENKLPDTNSNSNNNNINNINNNEKMDEDNINKEIK